jgi:RNA polymerase sigma-70 factor (ECF subfamily)
VRKKRQRFLFLSENEKIIIPDTTIDEFFNDDENELLIAKLQQEIQLLSYDERALLSMFYNNDKSVEEIASIAGISVSNVKVKLYRTRKKLYLKLNNLSLCTL